MVASIGDGEKEVETSANQDMVANSVNSQQSGKKRTTKTVKLTPAQALEILQQSLIECQKAGIEVKASSLYHHGLQSVAIIVANVVLDGGNLRIIGGNDGQK